MNFPRAFLILFFLIQCKLTDTNKVQFLNGDWNYRIGFNSEWLLNPGPESEWKTISLPNNLTKELKLNSYTGYITLRRELPFSLNQFLKQGKPLAINAGRVLDVSLFYFNKTLVGQLGSVNPYASGAMRPFIKDIPFTDLNYEKNVITIVLYTTNGKYPLQVMDKIEIGESDSVYLSYTLKEIFSFFFLTIYLAVGLYHILLASRRPKDLYNLNFGIFSLICAIYWFIANTFSRDLIFQDHVELHRKLEHIFLFSTTPNLLLFLVQFFEKRYTKISLGFAAFCLTLILLTIAFPLHVMRVCSMLWQASNLFTVPYFTYFVVRAIRRGNKDGIYMIIGLILLMSGSLVDIASSRGYIQLPAFANFTFLLFVMGIAAIMANRFMHVTNEVEILNAELEMKVEDRTKKLSESLEQVQTLKEQQDGDYYLTSLLLEPLSGNFIEGLEKDFKTETIIEQKKQFQFKKSKSEIGGDICVIDEIILQRLSYTVFLNGDAMGKSMQGAGGCLVLGTVFKSILERNHSNPDTRDMPPEVWVKESFKELQNVFVSFQGTMLISAMFGLIDNRNGTVYYVNAEHPFSILYRDGRANFIDQKNHFLKIGVELFKNPFQVHLFQMHPGDSLIMGSDGKDDILIGTSEDGERIINEDETLFLRILEATNSDLSKVKAELNKKGELTDDLSILKITYEKHPFVDLKSKTEEELEKELAVANDYYLKGFTSKAISSYEKTFSEGQNLEVLFDTINLYIEKKEFHVSSKLLDIYCNANPMNSNAIYLNSFVKKKNRELEEASLFGERYRLREPSNVKNLVNLADVNRQLNRMEITKKYLTRAIKLEPGNKEALKLQESILQDNFS
jgi:serine phosphatase RsbU (regulator of sigma subunit)